MDFWHVTPPVSFSACCHGRLCSFTGAKHLRLSGLSDGAFVTAQAATYPEQLARTLASTLAKASIGREVNQLWRNLSGVARLGSDGANPPAAVAASAATAAEFYGTFGRGVSNPAYSPAAVAATAATAAEFS